MIEIEAGNTISSKLKFYLFKSFTFFSDFASFPGPQSMQDISSLSTLEKQLEREMKVKRLIVLAMQNKH